METLAQNTLIQNRYLIVQMIGQGGMGDVYLAVDQKLGSAVALKRTSFEQDETLGSVFDGEAKILIKLRHPVLPKVIDHFAENGDQFLVMEQISGDDLAKRLEIAQKPFPLSWVMFWADQLLDALGYLHLHEPPIIHGDIKPENLKLTDENHIVLLDLGLPKDRADRGQTESPHSASMEQIRGSGTDARSDIFSFSTTLYQLLTNTVPASALTRAEALLGGASDPIVPLSEINPEVTPAISEVVLKGLGIQQEDRFATAAEMQKALRRAFNKPTASSEAETILVAAEPQIVATQSVSPEIPTQAHIDPGSTTMESTIAMDDTGEALRQSAVKTQILSPADISVEETQYDPRYDGGMSENNTATFRTSATVGMPTSQPFPAPKADLPQRARSTSRAGLAIGGVAALAVLTVIGAAAGWYAYTSYNGSSEGSVMPTPASASPSPAMAADTNRNSSTTGTVAGSNTEESNSNRASMTTQTPSGITTRPTPQTTTRNIPGRTTQVPTAKATPKPKQQDERTKILP